MLGDGVSNARAEASAAVALNSSGAEVAGATRHPFFLRSASPMLLADDQRRIVDANRAACLFLRMTQPMLVSCRVDDLTPPEVLGRLDANWARFLREGFQTCPLEVAMPDGARVTVDYSATANFMPGRHLLVYVFPAAGAGQQIPERRQGAASGVLSAREREVLSLVAAGHTGEQIAKQLFVAPTTVETHVKNALLKLNARNRSHGIALGFAAGELSLAPPAGGA